jgi:hypothetical protein
MSVQHLEVSITMILAMLGGIALHLGPNLGSPPLNFGLATTISCLQWQSSVVHTTIDPNLDIFTKGFSLQPKMQ